MDYSIYWALDVTPQPLFTLNCCNISLSLSLLVKIARFYYSIVRWVTRVKTFTKGKFLKKYLSKYCLTWFKYKTVLITFFLFYIIGCLPGSYGNYCEGTCAHCKPGTTCNVYTGSCPSGCATGYTGAKCEDSKCSIIKKYILTNALY